MIPLDLDAFRQHFFGKPYAYHNINYQTIRLGFKEENYKDLCEGETIAICPSTEDNKCSYIVFDFDGPKDKGATAFPFVKDFKKFLDTKKLKPTVFFSGQKGFHVYVFFDNLVDIHPLIIFAKKLLTEFTKDKNLGELKIEIFPKQSNIDWNNKKYGSHLKAPLSIHPTSNERSKQLSDYAVNSTESINITEDTFFQTTDVTIISAALLPHFTNGSRHKTALGVTGYLKYHDIDKNLVREIFKNLLEKTDADPVDIYRVIDDTYNSKKAVADLSYAELPIDVEEVLFSFVSGITKNDLKFKVLKIRDSKLKPHVKVDKCVEITIKFLSTAYRLYTDSSFIYIVYGEKLYTDQDESFFSLMLKFGFNKNESFARQVIYAVLDYIIHNGVKIEPIMYSRFIDDTIEVFTKDGVRRITKDGIKDEIDFLPVLKYKKFKVVKTVGILRYYLKGFELSKHDQDIIISWLVAQLFSDSLKTKPILLLQGPPGCGKTTLATFLLRLIESPDSDPIAYSGKEDSFTASMAIHKVLVLDNLEYIKPDMVDKLNSITTGTKIELRKLYTTNESVEIKPTCSVVITSAFAPMDNDGALQSRLIRINMTNRLEFGEENKYWEKFKEDYDTLYSEIISYGEQVLAVKKKNFEYILRFTDFLRYSKILLNIGIVKYDIEKVLYVRQVKSKLENTYYKIFQKIIPKESRKLPFMTEAIFPRFSAIARSYGISNLTLGSLTTQLLKTGLFQKLSSGQLILTVDLLELDQLSIEIGENLEGTVYFD